MLRLSPRTRSGPMGLMDFIKKQFIDVIQWTEDGEGTLAWRFPMAGMEIQNGASLTVREIADGGVRQRRQGGRCVRPRHVQADHPDPAGADLPEELGQAVRVPVQERRLLLQHPPAGRPALGHAPAHHHPRQGFRRGAAARLRQLQLPHRRSRSCSTPRSPARASCTPWPSSTASCAAWSCSTSPTPSRKAALPFLDLAANQIEFAKALCNRAGARRSRPSA